MLFPFTWVLSLALKTPPQAFIYPPALIPDPITFENFGKALFGPLPFLLFFQNTLIIAILVIVGDLLSCSLIAYGFARFRFPGRDILFLILLSTLMVPFIVRLVPLFVMFQSVGWINTFLPLVVPAFFGTPLFIFLMRQFFLTIPSELIDAARIDGANELQVWWRIMVPLSKPVMAAVVDLRVPGDLERLPGAAGVLAAARGPDHHPGPVQLPGHQPGLPDLDGCHDRARSSRSW